MPVGGLRKAQSHCCKNNQCNGSIAARLVTTKGDKGSVSNRGDRPETSTNGFNPYLIGYSNLALVLWRWSALCVAKRSSGFIVPLGFVAVLLLVVAFARMHHTAIPDAVGLTLVCFSFGWAYLAMWKVHRGCRRLGWDRSHYTILMFGSRPNDPDVLPIWLWTLQLCYAALAVVLSVLALVFTT